MRERIREIIRQTCNELGGHIVKRRFGAGSCPYVFVGAAEYCAVKGDATDQRALLARIQMEFPELRKRYWGRRFGARGYFSTTSGNVTDDIILQYLELHSKRDATGISR